MNNMSAKLLARLAMPDVCHRCWRIEFELHSKLPFSRFPGVFATLDSYTKSITAECFRCTGRLPAWLAIADGEPIETPNYRGFRAIDAVTGWTLCGTPDEIVRCPEGYHIFDYKTSRLTDHQDAMLPLYQLQLASYAWIATRLELNPVVRLALAYAEPAGRVLPDRLGQLLTDGGFAVPFTCRCVELPDMDWEAEVSAALSLASEITTGTLPSKRAGCEDCRRLGALWQLIADAASAKADVSEAVAVS